MNEVLSLSQKMMEKTRLITKKEEKKTEVIKEVGRDRSIIKEMSTRARSLSKKRSDSIVRIAVSLAQLPYLKDELRLRYPTLGAIGVVRRAALPLGHKP